jgi:hypothetical protein
MLAPEHAALVRTTTAVAHLGVSRHSAEHKGAGHYIHALSLYRHALGICFNKGDSPLPFPGLQSVTCLC